MNSSRWLPLIAFIGLACIGLGIYSLIHKPDNPAVQTAQASQNVQETTKPNTRPESQSTPSLPQKAFVSKISVPASEPWTNTHIQVEMGQKLIITASGKVVWKNITNENPNAYPKPYEECGPNGTPPIDSSDYYSNISLYQSRDAYKGALIGKVGENGLPFKIGSNFSGTINQDGILYLGINDMRPEIDQSAWSDNGGAFSVSIRRE